MWNMYCSVQRKDKFISANRSKKLATRTGEIVSASRHNQLSATSDFDLINVFNFDLFIFPPFLSARAFSNIFRLISRHCPMAHGAEFKSASIALVIFNFSNAAYGTAPFAWTFRHRISPLNWTLDFRWEKAVGVVRQRPVKVFLFVSFRAVCGRSPNGTPWN